MAVVKRKLQTQALIVALMVGGMTAASMPAHADSTVFDGPGFKVEKNTGWFGHKSASYTDALGNKVENKTGWFGRKTTRTKLFGSEAVRSGKNIVVNGPNGEPLVTHKRTLFHGTQTHVDGNSIFSSLKGMFSPAQTQNNP